MGWMASSATSESLSHENEKGASVVLIHSIETVRVIWGYEYSLSLVFMFLLLRFGYKLTTTFLLSE